ncbi:efflux RND transporter permease subunit [Legionella maceachernii]|uniref:Cation/multidrug efflux pump n=1 Tax=Legionella maceachernii TaxID=466 RepID=A0A0W0W6M8_9GAMM|nr:efflux RND transporter permease subunit [Legionella maceachernii]KTD28068.1 cation/multidrug efflux pump [Legionella maceachernii]SKA07981.1 Multidrug efflux pump subunit AcrB [Legionella maceachernii]SUO99758.1 Multidrug transporter MdtC [Legionella maceachernii]
MWLVWVALSRPYTFIVMALMLLIIGPLAILRTPTDIFPNINIPVVSVLWTFTGMPPQDMADRLTSVFERAVTTTVNDIEHIESSSLLGVSVTKLFFHPGVKIANALSEVTAIGQTLLKQMPPGTTPPQILSYNASSVPVLQLVLSSDTLPEQDLNDLGNNFIRTQLATVQGAALPFPYGGKLRQVQVDLNLKKMQTYGVSAQEVNNAINTQNLILPAGTEKIGLYEYYVTLNASPKSVDEMNNFPVKAIPGGVLYVRDVAHVRDGFPPQTNVVTVNGQRAVMMSVIKTGEASTLDIVNRVKALIPLLRDMMPPALKLSVLGDQSIFVTAAIKGVIREGVIAACLTGLMILIFLGSWRSTFIITLSIPLSILASLAVLSALGETINIMTLGGLALAVGILVDDATVAIENINWNLEQGKDVDTAIMDGAKQIAIPALVSTISICIVFVPMFYLGGVAQYLFAPLAEAVIFAMLASYVLSRTLVATLAKYLLKRHEPEATQGKNRNLFVRFHASFEERFDRFREDYHNLLKKALGNSKLFVLAFLAFILISIALLAPWLGSNFFPDVDAGQIKLHMQSPTGTRVEEAARLTGEIDALVREVIPQNELSSIVANIGLPTSGINLSYSNSATNAAGDADILISLNDNHKPVADYIRELRPRLQEKFPGVVFSFLPADIVNQILNFGLPSVIDIQVIGWKEKENRKHARMLLDKVKHIPGIVDAHFRQAFNYPNILVEANRSRARELGFDQFDIANNLLITLSGSFQTTPNFWVNPKNHVSYPIATQAPQYYLDSLQALKNIPITNPVTRAPSQILGALSKNERLAAPVVVSHYNVQPVIDIFASVQGTDLGSVAKAINKIIDETKKDVPLGSSVVVRGQIDTKEQAFTGLYIGLIFSIVLVYLLIVINFQSWLDPFIIITALPAALAGIVWMLFLTHTTLSVPALTGAIMCMGVATSNSILVISFARQHMREGNDPLSSALEAGRTRLRPVLMTALAMIIGMLPMALGMGEGGEQNAPLGRAVIGGLSFATLATLFFVPTIFYIIHNYLHKKERREKHD